jgi:Ca2+-binding RTX toxin-like protein
MGPMRLLPCCGLAALCLCLGQAAGAAQGAVPTCFGETATIVGTEGDDTLVGSAGPDVIVGGGGNDVIFGGAGEDDVCAGGGNDRLDGGADRDFLDAAEGNDRVAGGTGRNFLLPGPGDDEVVGGPNTDFGVYLGSASAVRVDLGAGRASGEGNDVLTEIEHVIGSNRNDVIVGDGGSNTFYGLKGDDRFDGGGDLDVVRYGFLTLFGVNASLAAGKATGEGTDTFIRIEMLGGSEQADVLTGAGGDAEGLFGEGGADILNGLASVDLLEGGPGNDRIEGGAGGDFLAGGPGDDDLRGGPGVDEATYEASTGRVVVDLSRGIASGEGTDRLRGIERVIGSNLGDHLSGAATSDSLLGGDGADVLRGAGGDDYLDGGRGGDSLRGGPGHDYCLDLFGGRGCEVAGVPGILPSRTVSSVKVSTDSSELGVATCIAGGLSVASVDAANKRPPRTSVAPPGRLRPRRPSGPFASLAQDEPERQEVSWQATLFRRDARTRRFVAFRMTRRMTATIARVPGFGGDAELSASLAWTAPDGAPARPTVLSLPPGRYAWAAELLFQGGERVFDWIEPHAYASGAGSRFRPACTFSR